MLVSKKGLPQPVINKESIYFSSFVNSLKAKLITNSKGKIISANYAACQLLGFTEKELEAKTALSILGISDPEFKALCIALILPGQGANIIHVTNKAGVLLPCSFDCEPFLDKKRFKNLITFIPVAANVIPTSDTELEVNVTGDLKIADGGCRETEDTALLLANALQEADARLTQSAELKKFTGKISYDIMWDWNILTDEIDVGDSVTELFGYKMKGRQISFKTILRCLLPAEKSRVKNKIETILSSKKRGWADSCMILRRDGSLAFTVSRAKIVRDADGNALHVIGATQDITRLHELEQQVKDQVDIHQELNEIFEVASNLSFDGRWDWNLVSGEFYFGGGFEELFGYDVNSKMDGTQLDWINYLHPDDKEVVVADLDKAIKSDADYWEYAYRFIRADGTFAKVFNRVSIIRNRRGRAVRILGVMQDITKQEILEDKLAQEIKLKDKKIEEATSEAKEAERADIGKELHDNVNQLLGASRMYIDLARRNGADKDALLTRSAEFTMTAIEEIRKLTKGLTREFVNNIGLTDAIENLCTDTMQVDKIAIHTDLGDFEGSRLSIRFLMNIYRIIQEQLSNILKHAKATEVFIKLDSAGATVNLLISDNGIGFDPAVKRKGIGVDNIRSRVDSFNGVTEFISALGEGCTLSISLPVETKVTDQN